MAFLCLPKSLRVEKVRGSPLNDRLSLTSYGGSHTIFMAKNLTLRSSLLSMAILSLVSVTASCRSSRTIMIPRYNSGTDRARDPFAGEVFRIDRKVDERDYALLAVCIGDKLVLAAQVNADFVGDVTWLVGECQLDFTITSEPTGAEVPVQVSGDMSTAPALIGNATAIADTVTVTVDVPRQALAKGDGTLVLKFTSLDGSEVVALPAIGRLRGIYLKQ